MIQENVDTVSLMFEAARSFIGGAKIIMVSDGIEDNHKILHPTLPVVICSAIAIEIQLKALLEAESIPRPQGDQHDLLLLLNALPEQTRNSFLLFQKTYTDVEKDAALELLANEKDTFKTWRYPYEKSEIKTFPSFLFHFALALSDYIKENYNIERSENGWLKKCI